MIINSIQLLTWKNMIQTGQKKKIVLLIKCKFILAFA